jgi:hypothetical protein
VRWRALPLGVGAAALVVLAGCFPTTVTVDPGQPIGPTLVLDVANASADQRTIAYEFEMGNSSGGGEGTLLACERSTMTFGEIGGRYTVEVDGEPVVDATMPPNVPLDRFVVVRIMIAADGTASAAAPVLSARAPPIETGPIAGCG